MVVSSQANSRRKTPFNLAIVLATLIFTSGCDNTPNRTVIQLHFKSGAQVEELLSHLLGDQIKYEVVGNTVIFDASRKEIKPALKVLESLDQPPVSYRLTVLPDNIRRFSTQKAPRAFYLVEGKTSTTEFNNLTLQMTLTRANNHQSLLNILSKDKDGKVNENHWLLPHGLPSNPDPRIFPKGITIQVQR